MGGAPAAAPPARHAATRPEHSLEHFALHASVFGKFGLFLLFVSVCVIPGPKNFSAPTERKKREIPHMKRLNRGDITK